MSLLQATDWLRALALSLALAPASALACTVSSSGLVFGSYNVFDLSDLHGAGTLSVDCATAYTISLSPSLNNGGFAPRRLDSADDTLDYYLYTDPARTTLWGDGSGGTATVAGSGSGSPVEHTIYGRIPANQNVRVGSYADSVTVTLDF